MATARKAHGFLDPALGVIAALGVGLSAAGCRKIDEGGSRPRAVASTEAKAGDHSERTVGNPGPTTMIVPDFARVADTVAPSVVTVISTVPRPAGRPNKALRGLGSGVVVKHKYILTNEHVVASASRVDVELATGERIPAEVEVAEPLLDLALLKLERGIDEVPSVQWSDDEPRPGQWVMAVGQPFGLGHTVTVGVISGLDRDHDDLGRPAGLDPDGFWSFIQTDASINIGNSGGPLVGADGTIVGITTAVRNDGQGLAFAIPAAMAQRFVDEAIDHGRVRLARLGIKAENDAGPEVSGRVPAVRVTQVEPGGPGAKAGLEAGDYILSMGGTGVRRVSEVAYLTQLHGVDAKLDVTLVRDGQTSQTVLIPVEAR